MRDDMSPTPAEPIGTLIRIVRSRKVMLDRDLAALYGVETRVLNQAVRRNTERFPEDFVFELTRDEIMGISQSVISSDIKFSKRVAVFTQEGVAMLSSVLRSPRAIHMNVAIMRAFVRLREVLSAHKEFAGKLAELERKLGTHDVAIREIVDTIKRMAALPEPEPEPNEAEQSEPEKPQIGFKVKETPAPYRRRKARAR